METTHPAAGIVANPSELLAVMRRLAGAAVAARNVATFGRPTVVKAYEAGRLAAAASDAERALYTVLSVAGIYCEDGPARAALNAYTERLEVEASDRG